jgi:beta-lactamase class D
MLNGQQNIKSEERYSYRYKRGRNDYTRWNRDIRRESVRRESSRIDE